MEEIDERLRAERRARRAERAAQISSLATLSLLFIASALFVVLAYTGWWVFLPHMYMFVCSEQCIIISHTGNKEIASWFRCNLGNNFLQMRSGFPNDSWIHCWIRRSIVRTRAQELSSSLLSASEILASFLQSSHCDAGMRWRQL